ncbi:hypothetical protein [Bradyrhizobium sp. CB3481]|uniref:hypothetical protein n=1 Tax=Bradyrhizobium sp. CB3481 TaxID=3039158 RepID=UPI0024B15E61|nr:hypothetical protein [Bradyrhizobium sp. CB3481]WFU16203.1 hypothetical protein QA643_35525 [Bradyrhizobium sp. CB3481]
MIADHTIVSARAEMSKHTAADRPFKGRLMAIAIGAALTMPALAAWGTDSPHVRQPFNGTATPITLPPVPYIESIPWMKWDANTNAFKTDLLLSPTQQWGIGPTRRPQGTQQLSAN